MGWFLAWIWIPEASGQTYNYFPASPDNRYHSAARCYLKAVMHDVCKTNKTADGRLISSCETSEEHFRVCNGRHDQLIQSLKYYRYDDITTLVNEGFFRALPDAGICECSFNGTPQTNHAASSSSTTISDHHPLKDKDVPPKPK